MIHNYKHLCLEANNLLMQTLPSSHVSSTQYAPEHARPSMAQTASILSHTLQMEHTGGSQGRLFKRPCPGFRLTP